MNPSVTMPGRGQRVEVPYPSTCSKERGVVESRKLPPGSCPRLDACRKTVSVMQCGLILAKRADMDSLPTSKPSVGCGFHGHPNWRS